MPLAFHFASALITLMTTRSHRRVKYAQAILATYLHNNPDGIGLSGLEDYKNVKIGSIDVTPNLGYGAVGIDKVPPIDGAVHDRA
jgi:hypothetical protein